ncbi:N-acetylmuramic acid 6-phosphate etherase [Aminobacter sp. AP02]|nr:N-acetylmuramic acid 6-phosphate etherase [Aminobacter sp. AP02]
MRALGIRPGEAAATSRSGQVASVSEQALISELGRLVSEERNPRTMDIDLLPTVDVLRKINDEDKLVAHAVEKVIPEIAAAVDRTIAAFRQGGRLIYMGAGTSGRIGVLDASECPPTFRVPPTMVVGLIAGGYSALLKATEGAEDSQARGAEALAEIDLTAKDVVVGIAASGRTPYVIGGLNYAKKVGATAVALSCNPHSAIAAIADIAISPVVGPEALTGSTRMKSGTAEKLVLNMLTTASMIGIGKTYENLMVDLKASNKKLVARAARIVMQASECTLEEAQAALAQTDNDVKLAILIVMTGMDIAEARSQLDGSNGFLRQAIQDAKQASK